MTPDHDKESIPGTPSNPSGSLVSITSTTHDVEKTADPAKLLDQPKPQPEFPSQRTVAIVMTAVFMTMFLVALDRTIIGTAIPKITDDFHSLGDIGWYASAYLLTSCSFQLLVGRIYTFYNPKWIYIANIAVFELGSIICGAAPNSTVFIIGRAIAGLGNAGVSSGAIILIVRTVPLHKRPAYTGLLGVVFGVSSVLAPLLGGAFTDRLTWRWCFWINLPLGGIAMTVIAFVLKLPNPAKEHITWRENVRRLDLLGTAVFLPAVVCFLLALQYGGTIYPWNDGRVIALFVISALFFAAFVAVQIWKQETATVPPRIIKQRSVAAAMWCAFCNGSAMMIMVYYIPVWFQAIKGVDAEKSGIMFVPYVLSLVVSSMTAGFATRKIGYFTQWMYVSAILMPIGAGLITTWTPTTNHAQWIGYQVIFGLGFGFGMQQPSVGVQTTLHRKDVPTGASLIFFVQNLGGAVFTSVGGNIFNNELAKALSKIAGLDPAAVVKIGATDLRQYVKPSQLPAVIQAYNHALVDCFDVALAISCMLVVGALCMEWKSVKQGAPGNIAMKDQAAKKAEKGEEKV